MNPKIKFKKFLSILDKKFTPKPTNEVVHTPYILLALCAIPFTIYNLAKEARKSMDKDYMDYEKMEIIFLEAYNDTNDLKTFGASIAKLPYMSGKMDKNNIYTFMFKYMKKDKPSLEKNQEFINAIILNAKVKPEDFNNFFTDIFAFFGSENYLDGMKYLLQNEQIKQHMINNNFSVNMNKEKILQEVSTSYKVSDSTLNYIKNLLQKDLQYNVKKQNKNKM